MPSVIITSYKILRTLKAGQGFSEAVAGGLKWGWRKSVYLAKNFGSKIVVGVI